ISILSIKSGNQVTLHCPLQEIPNAVSVVWYKQHFGEMPQKVGERLAYKEVKINPTFHALGFTIVANTNEISLTIPHININDGGLYYCGKSYLDDFALSSGVFLAVTGDEDVKVSVNQSSVSDSVPAGASVTLQCSVLSKSRAAELQVLWFRAAPSQSHPQIIYT
ncbi:putative immune-type receptor 13 isoform 1 precursor, partial [Silurus asotus]